MALTSPLLEPYYGGSHKAFLENWIAHTPQVGCPEAPSGNNRHNILHFTLASNLQEASSGSSILLWT